METIYTTGIIKFDGQLQDLIGYRIEIDVTDTRHPMQRHIFLYKYGAKTVGAWSVSKEVKK